MSELASELVTAPEHPVSAVLALGSNLGDSRSILARAVTALGEHPSIRLTAVSPLARTAPVGGPDQPDYLNQVVVVDTGLSAWELLSFGHELEQQAARVREVRWGPRTLDIDLISYHTLTSDHPRLHLPHPRAHQRAFVLAPWSWADPHATLSGKPVAQLAALAADAATVHRLETAEESEDI